MKQIKKRTKIILSVLIVFFIVLFAFLYIWWFGFSYPFFDSVTTEVARIPGLDSGISPQGLCILPTSDGTQFDFAMSGYISGQPSRVYIVRTTPAGNGKVTRTETYVTFTKDGKDIKTHFGGVTCTEEYMYIASGSEIIRAKLSDAMTTSGSAVEITDSFDVGFGAAFCYAYEGQLFVGEFYRPGNYETDPSHHIEVSGGTNHAFIYVYDLDEGSEGGIADMVPSKVLSVRDQVQGIAVTDNYIFLSTSYGLPDSGLHVYANVLGGEADSTVQFGETSVPLYILSAANHGETLLMPCMSEEICVKDGKIYILFESMSKKYRYVVHHRITHVLSVNIEDILDIDVKQRGAWF